MGKIVIAISLGPQELKKEDFLRDCERHSKIFSETLERHNAFVNTILVLKFSISPSCK